MEQIRERQFLHNLYFYERMFNFEVYTLLQAMINCGSSILVHGRSGSGEDGLVSALFDAKSKSGSTLFIGDDSIVGLYPKRNIAEHRSAAGLLEASKVSSSDTIVVRGLNKENVELFLSMCNSGQGLASVESQSLNFVLDEVAELAASPSADMLDLGVIDFVLTVEAHKLISISEVVKDAGSYTIRPFAEYVRTNEYVFYSNVSEEKIQKMRQYNYEEAERFLLSIRTYENAENPLFAIRSSDSIEA
ncbi:hypothetical protein [Paenibacillus sp. Y412MC10]|uniref:hypothetical protein n=1 Tax=Geobacillus sp. (strain Y412MC10) TaxID=481743 RepID=UPI0011AB5A2D|nr:hypothetical protein [Paenibacillus sp. Y412MC10]